MLCSTSHSVYSLGVCVEKWICLCSKPEAPKTFPASFSFGMINFNSALGVDLQFGSIIIQYTA